MRWAPLAWVLACAGEADDLDTGSDSAAESCLPDSDFDAGLSREGALIPDLGAARWLTSSGLGILEIQDQRFGYPGDFDDDIDLSQVALHTIDPEHIHDCSVVAASGAVRVTGSLAACDDEPAPCTTGALHFDITSLVFEDAAPLDGEFLASFVRE